MDPAHAQPANNDPMLQILASIAAMHAEVSERMGALEARMSSIETYFAACIDTLRTEVQAEIDWQAAAQLIRTINKWQIFDRLLRPLPPRPGHDTGAPPWGPDDFPKSKEDLYHMTAERLKAVMDVCGLCATGPLSDQKAALDNYLCIGPIINEE